MTVDQVTFYGLAVGLVASGLLMVLSRNLVHAVIAMVANFALTGVLYLLLHAPFLAVVQVTVYAGAIMVLFLFVVMILGRREVALAEPLAGQRLFGLAAVLLLGGALLWATSSANGLAAPPVAAVPADFGSPQSMGQAVFTRYVLPFEVVSILLLAAVLGAVVLGKFRGEVRGIGSTDDDKEDEG